MPGGQFGDPAPGCPNGTLITWAANPRLPIRSRHRLDLFRWSDPLATPGTGQPQVGHARTCDAFEQLGIGLQGAARGREMKRPLSRWAWLTEGRRHQGGGSNDPARLKKVASRCSHDGMLMVFVGVGHQFGVCPIYTGYRSLGGGMRVGMVFTGHPSVRFGGGVSQMRSENASSIDGGNQGQPGIRIPVTIRNSY